MLEDDKGNVFALNLEGIKSQNLKAYHVIMAVLYILSLFVVFLYFTIFKHDNNSGFGYPVYNKAKEKWANERNDALIYTKSKKIYTKVDNLDSSKCQTSLKFANPDKVNNWQKSYLY